MTLNKKYYLFVGTYTSPGRSEGIYVFEFDTQTAGTKYKSVAVISNPSYFALTRDQRFLYAVSEDQESRISGFAFNPKNGELRFLNSQLSGGAGPTYISVDDNGKYVFAANYKGGSITVVPIEENGLLGADIQDIKHEGKSIVKDKPFVHSAVLSPDNKFVFAADLGTDRVNIYKYDPGKRPSPLSRAQVPFVTLHPGAGPRHTIFHPSGNFFYVVAELSSVVMVYRYRNGKLTHIQMLTLLPEGYSGKGDGADIQVSADGRFLYANTRNVINEILVFSINRQNGLLTQIGRHSTMGERPRTFTIDPSGDWLVVPNQGSNSINILRRDQKTGLLSPSGIVITVDQPSLVKFAEIGSE
ncbi:MAG TPA: lactonase family protein [Sphingobacteriaceae bacterium]